MRFQMKLRRKKPEDSSSQQEPQKKKLKGKSKGFEVSEDKMKFFIAKGVGKKHARYAGGSLVDE